MLHSRWHCRRQADRLVKRQPLIVQILSFWTGKRTGTADGSAIGIFSFIWLLCTVPACLWLLFVIIGRRRFCIWQWTRATAATIARIATTARPTPVIVTSIGIVATRVLRPMATH